MSDVSFPHAAQAEELAQLHFFSIRKREAEIRITVKEFAIRNAQGMKFFAQAEQAFLQAGVAFYPFGWGETLSEALGECIGQIRRHDYQPSA
jgi:hypothetical protein